MIETERLILKPLTYWQISLTNGAVVGEIHIKGEPANGRVEIGYGIEPQYQGRGFMREAVAAFCERLLAEDGIEVIMANTLPENFASQNVLSACGFRQSGKAGKELVWEFRG
jgi:RimJ/RimL family protein N-acetyltransferase